MKILVLFYSTWGHNYIMAKAAVEGVKKSGVDVELKQVEETLSDEILGEMGAIEAKKTFKDVPVANPNDLADYDGTIFCVPTRYGNMPAQFQAFFDATGELWQKGALIGKVGSVMTSSATQHGGQETTIISTHTVLLHHGYLLVGLSYGYAPQTTIDEITGGSPYGASTITGGDGSRMPSENELGAARYQGERVGKIVKKLFD